MRDLNKLGIRTEATEEATRFLLGRQWLLTFDTRQSDRRHSVLTKGAACMMHLLSLCLFDWSRSFGAAPSASHPTPQVRQAPGRHLYHT